MLLSEHSWQQASCLRRAARPRRLKGRQAVLAALELEQVLGQPLVCAEEALGRRLQLDGRRVLGSHARPAADDEPRLALVCEELAVAHWAVGPNSVKSKSHKTLNRSLGRTKHTSGMS